MKPQDFLPSPPPNPPLPRFLVREEPPTRQLPQTQLTREDVRVELWAERDRLHIGIQDKETGGYIVSWWDDEASQMFDQGFFYDPGPLGWRIPAERRKFDESVLAYAEKMGILAPGSLPQTVPTKPPPGYAEWKVKLDAGYGTYRLGVPPEQVVEEFQSIPRDVRLHYFREALPPSQPLSAQTQPFAPPGVDSELESLVEAKRREWEGKGYPPALISRALTMAREWPASMFASRLYQAVRGTPAELEAQRQLYRMGLNVAQRWIEAMHRS